MIESGKNMEQPGRMRYADKAIQLVAPITATISLAGFIVDLTFHALAWLGGTLLMAREYVHILFMGVFVVWVPTVLIGGYMTRNSKRNDYWKVALRGCPRWMRIFAIVVGAYAALNFVLFAIYNPPKGTIGRERDLVESWGMSGHVLIFYWIAFALNYSAMRVVGKDIKRRCPLGHIVSLTAKYCEQCGIPIQEE